MNAWRFSACGPGLAPAGSPFCLADDDAFFRWRDLKLRHYPRRAEDLVVELGDPLKMGAEEREAIALRLARSNMAVYTCNGPSDSREIPRAIAREFGLAELDANWLSDEDAMSRIEVREDRAQRGLIPYTNLPIHWHTDGYYNPPSRPVLAMLLHCVRDAAQGGENELLDHEMAYLLLREWHPDLVRALSAPDAMSIPERLDAGGVARPERTGPVFSVDARTGRLHMRYTARTRSIRWRDDDLTRAAVKCLADLLEGRVADSAHWPLRLHMVPGMGLICANVLHTRTGFVDDPVRPRLLYRARYYDPICLTQPKQGDPPCNSTRNWTPADSPVPCPS